MTRILKRRRSVFARVVGRLRSFLIGDRVLVPRSFIDPMWHLETARRHIVGGELVVRFDNVDADIALDARSDLAIRALCHGVYEPELLAAVPGLVGAGDAINVGLLAIVMRKAMATGTRLLCIEPIEDCVARLTRNLDRAGIGQGVVIRQAFATDRSTETHEMWTVPGKPEYSSGGRLVHPSVAAAEHISTVVPTIRLDEAVTAEGLQPTCIVMDCEGGEFSALRGATKLLSASQPTIVMEFDPILLEANGETAIAFLRFLADHGYRCLTLDDPSVEADESFSGTVVAVPTSRVAVVGNVIRGACSGRS